MGGVGRTENVDKREDVIKVNGGRIAYAVRGTAVPGGTAGPGGAAGPRVPATAILLIMGLGIPGSGWDRQAYALAKEFTVVTYDNRGTGASDPAPMGYSIDAMAADAIGVLDHLGIARAHVVGISMGGFIAQTIALDHPERVDRLVLCSTAFGGPEQVSASSDVLADLAGFGPPDRTPEERLRRRLRINFGEDFINRHPAEVRSFLESADRMPVAEGTRMVHLLASAEFDRSADVARITVPTLVMAGTDDILVPPENSRLLAARIPGARLLFYQGAGHSFIFERAREFNRDVAAFLKGL